MTTVANSCPECGERTWRYRDDLWTCAHGHHLAFHAPGVVPGVASPVEPEPPAPVEPEPPVSAWPLGGLLLAAGTLGGVFVAVIERVL